jgi:endonuclease YncB( thermonuclease family)
MIVALVTLISSPAFAETITGQASVIDGDTLEIHGRRIRLSGIDASESSQLCRGDDSLQYRISVISLMRRPSWVFASTKS